MPSLPEKRGSDYIKPSGCSPANKRVRFMEPCEQNEVRTKPCFLNVFFTSLKLKRYAPVQPATYSRPEELQLGFSHGKKTLGKLRNPSEALRCKLRKLKTRC